MPPNLSTQWMHSRPKASAPCELQSSLRCRADSGAGNDFSATGTRISQQAAYGTSLPYSGTRSRTQTVSQPAFFERYNAVQLPVVYSASACAAVDSSSNAAAASRDVSADRAK